ncbi:MAG: sugar phosphate nucleotidyltransferase, partial [Candidatus Omnitrophota bacterium]
SLQYIDSTEKIYLQEVFRGLGWAYFHKRDYKKTIEYFEKILNEGLSEAPIVLRDIFRGLGWTYYYLCDYDAAIRDFLKARKYIDGKDKFYLQEIFRGLGWTYYKKRNFNEAIDNFNLALKNTDPVNQKIVKDSLRGLELTNRLKDGKAPMGAPATIKRPAQAVILAGGRGERLKPLTDTLPKPMIKFNGKPFLEYLICQLKEQGFGKVLLLLGYLPDVIQEYFGDGQRWGIKIEYSVSEVENDTGKRIKLAQDKIDPFFLLMYCDNYWPMNIDAMWKNFLMTGASAQITVYTNKDNYTRNNVAVDCDGMVVCYDKSRSACGLNGVDIGFVLCRKEVIDTVPDENVNFEKAVFPVLVQDRGLSAYLTGHRYYSVGSHEKLPITEAFLKKARVIIMDRDGVLNEKAPKPNMSKPGANLNGCPGLKKP